VWGRTDKMCGVVQKKRGIVVPLFQRLNVDYCKFLLPNILDRYYKELNPNCLLPYADPATIVQSMFILSLICMIVCGLFEWKQISAGLLSFVYICIAVEDIYQEMRILGSH